MRLVRSLAVLGTCLALGAAGVAVAADAGATTHPSTKSLRVSMHFARSHYAPGATAHLTIKLRNTGSTRLTRIGAACDRAGDPAVLRNKGRGWGALASNRSGVTVAAHRTKTVHVTAKVPAAAQRLGAVVAACDFGHRGVDTGYRPQARASARVPGQSGAIDGTIQYNVAGDSGATAGLGGVRVVLADPTACPVKARTATSDAKGHFHIAGAPAGSAYRLYLFPPSGWKVIGGNSTPVMIIGRNTAHVFLQAGHGTAHTPAVPTKCR